MHAEAQGVAILVGLMAADPNDGFCEGVVRIEDDIATIAVLHHAGFEAYWDTHRTCFVYETDTNFSAIPRRWTPHNWATFLR